MLTLLACAREHQRTASAGPTEPRSSASDAGSPRDAAPIDARPQDAGQVKQDAGRVPTDARAPDVEASVQSHEQFCQRNAEQLCSVLAGCCGAPDLNMELCVRYQRFGFVGRPLGVDQAYCFPDGAEPASFDRGSAETCLELTRESYDGCHLVRRDAPRQREREEACARVAPLPLPNAKRCMPGSLCESPPGTYSECLAVSEGAPNTCTTPLRYASQGESCASSQRCEAWTTCSTSTATCTDLLADGSPCRSSLDCSSGECSALPEGQGGQCASQRPDFDARTCAEIRGLDRYGLYAGLAWPRWVNSHDLVGIDESSFYRAPKDGSGPVVKLALPQGALADAVDDERLYARVQDQQHVLAIALADGTSESIELPFVATALAIDAANIYVAAESCASLARISKTDHTVTIAHAQLPRAPDQGVVPIALLDASDSGVFCANRYAVVRFALTGSADATLLTSVSQTDGPSFVERMLVGTERLWLLARLGAADRFLQVPLAGGTLVDSTDQFSGVGGGGKLDVTRTHWLSGSDEGVQVFSIADATSALLPAEPIQPGAYLIDDRDFVYWTDTAAVFRRPK